MDPAGDECLGPAGWWLARELERYDVERTPSCTVAAWGSNLMNHNPRDTQRLEVSRGRTDGRCRPHRWDADRRSLRSGAMERCEDVVKLSFRVRVCIQVNIVFSDKP